MRDLLLQCAGLGAIAASLLHGVIGETKIFPRATIEPPRLRTLIWLVWQAGTVAWIGFGALADRRTLDGVGGGTALDHCHVRLRVRLCRVLQRVGVARPAFWLGRVQRCRGDGGRGVLASSVIPGRSESFAE